MLPMHCSHKIGSSRVVKIVLKLNSAHWSCHQRPCLRWWWVTFAIKCFSKYYANAKIASAAGNSNALWHTSIYFPKRAWATSAKGARFIHLWGANFDSEFLPSISNVAFCMLVAPLRYFKSISIFLEENCMILIVSIVVWTFAPRLQSP